LSKNSIKEPSVTPLRGVLSKNQGTKRCHYTHKSSKTYSTSVTARQAEEMLTSLRESIEMQIIPATNLEQENNYQETVWTTSKHQDQQFNSSEQILSPPKMIKLQFESETQQDSTQLETDNSSLEFNKAEVDLSQDPKADSSIKSSHSSCRKLDCKKHHHRKRRCRCKRRRKFLTQNVVK